MFEDNTSFIIIMKNIGINEISNFQLICTLLDLNLFVISIC